MKSVILSIILSIFFIKVSFGISDEEYQEISFLIEQNNIEKSFEILKSIQSSEKKLSPRSRVLFGKFYIELEKPAKALEYFKSVSFSSTKFDAIANAGIAKAEFMLGNIEKSRDFAEKSLLINPDLIDGKITLVQILSEQMLTDRSEKLFLSAMRASGKRTYAGRKYVETLLRQNKIKKAEEILKKTMIEGQIDAPSLLLYSDIFWIKGNIDNAVSYRTEAEEKYRKAGNTIKANQIISWLNLEALPKLEKIKKNEPTEQIEEKKEEKPETKVPPKIEEVQPKQDNTINENIVNLPKRKAFQPRNKPEDIMIDTSKGVFSGSGVILDNGYSILTNKHVVEGLEYVVVRNGLGEIRYVSEISESISDDLAILTLDKPFPSEYSIKNNEFNIGETGSKVFVIGYPMSSVFGSFHPTITEGIISNPLGFGESDGQFQITAKVNPGNSGGPIFNKFGEIVGIATGKINKEEVLKNEGFIPEDINYAVKTDRVASFLNLPIKVSLKNTSETNYEYNAQELYKYMRSAVVLIVGQE